MSYLNIIDSIFLLLLRWGICIGCWFIFPVGLNAQTGDGNEASSKNILGQADQVFLLDSVPKKALDPQLSHAYLLSSASSKQAIASLKAGNVDKAIESYTKACNILKQADPEAFREEILKLYYYKGLLYAQLNMPIEAHGQVDSMRSMVEVPSESDLWRLRLADMALESLIAGSSGDYVSSMEAQMVLLEAIDSLGLSIPDFSDNLWGIEMDFSQLVFGKNAKGNTRFHDSFDHLNQLFGNEEFLKLLDTITDTASFLRRIKEIENRAISSTIDFSGILTAKLASMVVQVLALHGFGDEMKSFRNRFENRLRTALPLIVGEYFTTVGSCLSLHEYYEDATYCFSKVLKTEGAMLDSLGISLPHHVSLLSLLETTHGYSKLCFKRYWNDTLQKGDPGLLDQAWDYSKAFLRLVRLRQRDEGVAENIQFLNMKAHEGFETALQVAFALYQTKRDEKFLLEAFGVCEESKAFSLNGQFLQLKTGAFNSLPLDIRMEEMQFLKRIEHLNGMIVQLEDSSQNLSKLQAHRVELKREHQAFINRNRKAFPGYFAPMSLQGGLRRDSLLNVIQKLDCSFIEYFIGDENIFIFLLQDGKVSGYRRRSYMEFVPEVERFMSLLASGKDQATAFANQASTLYITLFYPLEKKLKHTKLVIVPDATLSGLPFECLVKGWEANVQDDYKHFDYLLKHYEISYAYSGQAFWHQMQKHEREYDGQVHYFAPGFDQGFWQDTANCLPQPRLYSQLPPQDLSVDFAGNLEGNYSGNFRSGMQAGEYHLKSLHSRCSILHFNTHGRNEGEGQLSGELYLARDHGEEDGILHGFEIQSLSLLADLVILSACESGSGVANLGESRQSLSTQFNLKSCSVLQADWKIDEVHSLGLLEKFYENIGKGMGRSEALRVAKLAFLDNVSENDQKLANPFYWAGLNLYGAPTPLTSPIIHQSSPLGKWILIAALISLFVFVIIKIIRRK